jgi:hypothetical protein
MNSNLTQTITRCREIAACVDDARVIERAVIDHVEAVLAHIKPMPAHQALKRVLQLTSFLASLNEKARRS